MTAPLPCALYARVSTDEQAEKYGLGSQLTELRALAARRGYTIVGEYVDDGVSGATLDRPKLTALRSVVRAREVDVVLAHASDRLARDLDGLLILRMELRTAGVRVEYVSHSPDDTPEGELREQMLGAIAQYERAKIRERTSRGAREKARKGLYPWGRVPYGYRRDESALGGLAVDDGEAASVRQMFTWVAEGVSIRALCARLDAQGIAPRDGTRWSRTSVRRILRSEVYTGEGIFNRRTAATDGRVTIRDEAEWIRYAITPLVSPALAARARAQLGRNRELQWGRTRRPRYVFLLSGLLTCHACGRRMHGDSKNQGAYRCEGRLAVDETARCQFRLAASQVDATIWTMLRNVIRDPGVLQSVEKAARLGIDDRRVDAQTALAEFQRTLAKVTKRRARLVDLYVEGRIEKDDFTTRERPLVAEAARLETAIAETQARLVAGQADVDSHAALVKYCRFIGRGIDRLDAAGRQALVRKIVDRVVASPDRLDVQGAFPLAPPPTDDAPKPATSRAGMMRRSPIRKTSRVLGRERSATRYGSAWTSFFGSVGWAAPPRSRSIEGRAVTLRAAVASGEHPRRPGTAAPPRPAPTAPPARVRRRAGTTPGRHARRDSTAGA